MSLRRGLVTVLGLLAVAALLGLGARGSSAWQRAAALPPLLWVLALAGLLASYGLRAARLHAEWLGRAPLPPRACLRVTLMHIAAVNVLPMRAGELGYPWLLRRHGGMALADAISSLVWMRLQDATVLLWLATLAVLATLRQQALLGGPQALGAALAASVLFLAGAARLAPLLQALLARLQHGQRLPRLRPLMAAVQQAGLRARPATWAWCLANWLTKLGTGALLLAALAAVPALSAWCGALGGELGAALPVQPPAGLGTYEAGVALAASQVQPAAWTDLLGAALVLHLFCILSAALAGAAATLGLAGCLPRVRAASSSASPMPAPLPAAPAESTR